MWPTLFPSQSNKSFYYRKHSHGSKCAICGMYRRKPYLSYPTSDHDRILSESLNLVLMFFVLVWLILFGEMKRYMDLTTITLFIIMATMNCKGRYASPMVIAHRSPVAYGISDEWSQALRFPTIWWFHHSTPRCPLTSLIFIQSVWIILLNHVGLSLTQILCHSPPWITEFISFRH